VLQYFGFQDTPALPPDPRDTSLTVGSPLLAVPGSSSSNTEGGLLQNAKTLIEQSFWGEQRSDVTPQKSSETPGE
jgi:hypothetical protein